MGVKFDVQMTTKAMYNFMLFHTYSTFGGVLGAVFGVIAVILGVRAALQGDYTAMATFFFMGVLFLLMTPITLRSKAKAQVKGTPMFQKPISYELLEEGVKVSQDGQEVVNSWKDFSKAVSSGGAIILYITRVRAIIFTREAMGEQYATVVEMISTHMPPSKVKLRQVR
ncbi:MAG: YcxB family protein [Lachnospiraceae bacterium]